MQNRTVTFWSSRLSTAITIAMLTAAAGVPHAGADPDPGFGDNGQDCESDPVGTLFCDGPVEADGSWTRCVELPPVFWEDRPINPTPICQDYGPENPPGPGQPSRHIGDSR